MKSQWGFSKLISKESLRAPGNGFLVDDTCVFGAEVAVIKTQRVTEFVSVREIGNPYKRDWKISDFSKLKEVWISEEFTAGDHRWSFLLYPNGDKDEEGRSFSIYLFLICAESFAPNEKVKADFCFRFKNQLNDQHRCYNASHWFTTSSVGWGRSEFIPLSDMRDPNKGFVVKDCCIVEVEISVKVIATTTNTKVAANEYSRLSSQSSGWSRQRDSDDYQVQNALSELSKRLVSQILDIQTDAQDS